jgi:hypothetical protein
LVEVGTTAGLDEELLAFILLLLAAAWVDDAGDDVLFLLVIGAGDVATVEPGPRECITDKSPAAATAADWAGTGEGLSEADAARS